MKINKRVAWNKGMSGEEYLKHYPKGLKGTKGKRFPKKKFPNFGQRNKNLSSEHKRKIKENHSNTSGKNNGMYGKKHSEE